MSGLLDAAIKNCAPGSTGARTQDTNALYAIALGIKELVDILEREEARRHGDPDNPKPKPAPATPER